MTQPAQDVLHASAAVTFLSTLLGWAPPVLGVIGSIMGITWYCHLFYDRYFKK